MQRVEKVKIKCMYFMVSGFEKPMTFYQNNHHPTLVLSSTNRTTVVSRIVETIVQMLNLTIWCIFVTIFDNVFFGMPEITPKNVHVSRLIKNAEKILQHCPTLL